MKSNLGYLTIANRVSLKVSFKLSSEVFFLRLIF